MGVVILFDDAGGVPHNFIHRLDHAVRRQAAILFAQVCAIFLEADIHCQLLRRRELGTDEVAGVGGEYIVVVKAGGTAVLHQLAHAGERGETDDTPVQPLPDFI